MQSNPIVWRIFDINISVVRGRCLAAFVFAADVGAVVWGYLANDGLSNSVRRSCLLVLLSLLHGLF